MSDRIVLSPRTFRPSTIASAVRLTTLISAGIIVSHAPALAQKPGAKPAAAATAKPAAVAVKIPGTTVTLDLVKIPAGSITLPDAAAPGGKRTVKVKSLLIGKTELLWEAYDTWTTNKETPPAGTDAIAKPSHSYIPPDRGYGHVGFPTISVSSQGATNFCQWLSKVTGKKFRLPTEDEWAYAALAGQKPAAKPLAAAQMDKMAWTAENAGGKTQAAGKKLPNAWGLYDMLGNVGEYCTAADGSAVLRGGTFQDKAATVSWASRAPYTPDWQMGDPQFPKSKWWYSDGPFCGFRIVCEP